MSEKKWEEEARKASNNYFPIARPAFIEGYLQARKKGQEEIERFKLVIRKLSIGLDDFWVKTPEGKAIREEVRKIFEEAK